MKARQRVIRQCWLGSNSRGLCRWSRLAKRCTWTKCSRPAGAALSLFLRPTRAICCLCWRSGDMGGRKRGRAWCSNARACKRHLGPASWYAPLRRRPPLHRLLRIACDRHQKYQWCVGKRAGQRHRQMKAWSRGRVHMHAHAVV